MHPTIFWDRPLTGRTHRVDRLTEIKARGYSQLYTIRIGIRLEILMLVSRLYVLNISVFNALSIVSGLVAAVLLIMKREVHED